MVIIIQKSMLSNGKFQDVQERVTHIIVPGNGQLEPGHAANCIGNIVQSHRDNMLTAIFHGSIKI